MKQIFCFSFVLVVPKYHLSGQIDLAERYGTCYCCTVKRGKIIKMFGALAYKDAIV